MANKPPIRIALDIETTGLHAEQDAILEVAAIKFQGATILDTYESLVAPGRAIPYRVQRLTGITPQAVSEAPHFESIARQLQLFLGDFPLVGHSIPFDVGFLRRRGLAKNNLLIDTFELATILLPSLPSYNLGQVAEALGVTVTPGRHRAMVDTVLAMQVFLALHEQLQAVDLSLLKDLANLDAPRSWPLLGFFRQELREREAQDGLYGARGSLGDQFAAQLGMDPRILSFAIAQQSRSVESEADKLRKTGRRTSLSQTSSIDGEPLVLDLTSALPDSLGLPASVGAFETLSSIPLGDALETLVEVIPEDTKVASQSTQAESSLSQMPSPAESATTIVSRHALTHGYEASGGYSTAYGAVHEALEKCTPLLMEVTIGANDYTPVLLPALEWLTEAREDADGLPRRLVIACANQQGARRLIETVLPRLQNAFKSELPVAYLAEQGGYLCLHRWFGSARRRTNGELSAEQARGLAKFGLWAQQTVTGERGELTLLPQENRAWERISSGVEHISLVSGRSDTAYSQCTYRRKGYCFVERAEERIQHASIVVTTHVGLFDDLSSSHSLLKSIDRRLILDADLLEEESARWNTSELDSDRLLDLLNTIGAELPENRYQGLLALAAPTLRENGPGGLSSTPTIAKTELDSRMLTWFQSIRQASVAVEGFFSALGHLFEEFQQQGSNGNARNKGKAGKVNATRSHGNRSNERSDSSIRLTGQIRNLATWKDTQDTWQQVAHRLQTVIDLTHEAEKIILATKPRLSRLSTGIGEENPVAWELAAIAEHLLEQKRLGEQAMTLEGVAMAGGENEMVYWLRLPPPPAPFQQQTAQQRQALPVEPAAPAQVTGSSPLLYAQLVQTTALLKRQLLSENACTIFAGTALAVDNNFSFYRGRYGLDADVCPAFSIVTEHSEQTLLYLPNDVPEPNMPQYQRHLDEAIVQLATALDGQLVVLFTSYASLRSSYGAIKQLLETQGILVLGHGIDGSPRQLWQMFSHQERVVLLGTGSFWDGIDEITRPPACILITRLPMPVLHDPPVAARIEHYSDQLHQVTLPIAAVRMRRALNRLAWSNNRRNAIVLFDRRVLSKEYGQVLLNSLPHSSQRQGPVSHMPEVILDWLTTTGSWE